MRYFAELSYKGTNYSGWQRQDNAISVQEIIEDALSTILNTPIVVTGCGRTDTGVHASQYYLHFDFEGDFPEGFVNRLNKFLPKDIAFRRIFEVDNEAHTRFDATKRSYYYLMDVEKSPFDNELAYFYYAAKKLDINKLNKAAGLLLDFGEFAPFCKTGSDVKTMKCNLFRSEWIFDENQKRFIYYISANRFLRGMVRLIVGSCILVAEDRLTFDALKTSLIQQSPLPKNLSAPAQGLYLSEIEYPFIEKG